MAYSYFPGCTLHQQERVFDLSARVVAQRLGIDMVEPENWQCCGAVFPLASDALFPLISPYRTLVTASDAGNDVVTLCSGCFNVLRRTAKLVNEDEEVRGKLAAFTELEPEQPLRVIHFVEMLAPDEITEVVAVDLTGLRVASYYGCLLVRPDDELEFDDPEQPQIIDKLLAAVGAEPVSYPHKTECCGAYLSVVPDSPRSTALQASDRVLQAAADAGADVIVVSCPLCKYNLLQAAASRAERGERTPPVIYFTQVLAHALGASVETSGFTDPRYEASEVTAG